MLRRTATVALSATFVIILTFEANTVWSQTNSNARIGALITGSFWKHTQASQKQIDEDTLQGHSARSLSRSRQVLDQSTAVTTPNHTPIGGLAHFPRSVVTNINDSPPIYIAIQGPQQPNLGPQRAQQLLDSLNTDSSLKQSNVSQTDLPSQQFIKKIKLPSKAERHRIQRNTRQVQHSEAAEPFNNDPFSDESLQNSAPQLPQNHLLEPLAPAKRSTDVFGSAFEVIDDQGKEFTITVRRSKLLRSPVDIYRTAVVDPKVCEIIQFTPSEVSIIGKSQGSTNITFWFEESDKKPTTYLVRVIPDPERRREQENQFALLAEVIRELFPDSSIELVLVAKKLIVRGQAKDAEEASQIMKIVRGEASSRNRQNNLGNRIGGVSNQGIGDGFAAQVLSDDETGRQANSDIQIVNMLRVPGPQQVALRVKIAELNRSAARGFGVDLEGTINFNGDDGSQVFLQSILNVATGNAPALITQFDGDDISVGIRHLEEHGVVRLLSEPTLVTMSGRPATFVAGGEFAIPTTVGVSGAAAVTTDFRSFGAIISFLPVVLNKDRIRLEVSPEFSQINSSLSVQSTPGLDVRAVTTTVEMREGQTLAIAGLLDDSMTANRSGDVPLISQWLARRDISRNETELIILVTPELVHPMEPEEVPPLPGFDVTEPTNSEFYLSGRLEGKATREYRSTVWPSLRRRYRSGSANWTSGPFGHGQ